MVTLDAMGESVITVDAEGRIDYVNTSAEAMLGQSFDQIVGKSFSEVASLVDEADRRPLGDPVRKALATGGRVTMGKRAVLVPASTGAGALGRDQRHAAANRVTRTCSGWWWCMHDTSELRGLTRQMTYQASHDALTGLVNRREFERRLQRGDGFRADRRRGARAVLPRSRPIQGGQRHLRAHRRRQHAARGRHHHQGCGARLRHGRAASAATNSRCCWSGCPLEKARQIADDVVRSVDDYRFVWKDKIFNIGVSIGLVEIGRGGGSIEDIMNSADSACYVAKKQGGVHVHVYSAREEANARHRGEIHWLQKLQGALRDNKFELYYQPIVHAARCGVERPGARGVRAHGGRERASPAAPPAEFIRAAERYRLMPLVDRWVVQAVLSALGRGGLKLPPRPQRRDQHRGPDARRRGIPRVRGRLLRSHRRESRATSASRSPRARWWRTSTMRAASSRCCTAWAANSRWTISAAGSPPFATLKTLPMDYLKIDGSFIRNLAADTVNQAMVGAMIELSRSLNFRVVAEQVEDQPSLGCGAASMGIDFVQGFIIGRPQPLSMHARRPADATGRPSQVNPL